MNANPSLSIAGVWPPVSPDYLSETVRGSEVYSAQLAKLGAEQSYGLAETGLEYIPFG